MDLKLTPRLQTVADLIENCDTVADIGTDHAFLPIFPILSDKCEKCIAADVAKGPLSRAERYITEYLGQTQRIKTVLSDGLQNVNEKCDYIVIAGMGGETIYNILSAKDIPAGQKLILQPMSKSPELREYLYSHGFRIVDEMPVCEDMRAYTVISAMKTDENIPFRLLDTYISVPLREKKGADKNAYTDRVLKSLRKKIHGLEKSSEPDTEEISRLRSLEEEILLLE